MCLHERKQQLTPVCVLLCQLVMEDNTGDCSCGRGEEWSGVELVVRRTSGPILTV